MGPLGSAAVGGAGCGSDPYAGETTATGTKTATTIDSGFVLPASQSDMYFAIRRVRKLDLVFMIDNSPGTSAKVDKMLVQFPKLIGALKDPATGSYPDLRIAIIDSDLGTGGAYTSGACGPNIDNEQSTLGDVGHFQMRDAVACGMQSADALWIEYEQGAPANYNGPGDKISDVFACLARNLGTGCDEEHSLQAFELALAAPNLLGGKYAQQKGFLRPEASLGLVFITDEDDCSAATHDGMFGDKPELIGESASLRCATRSHQCNGSNLSTTGPGYPTTQSFVADFASCSARTDACPSESDGNAGTDTSVPTRCSPLESVKTIASRIKTLKGGRADAIVVAGIFGWPRVGADGNPDLAGAQYRIDLVPNPNPADTAHPEIYDYWPVCYEPGYEPKSAAYDGDAWGRGAQGGLRLSAFVDEFGANGLKYSICEADLGPAMSTIGVALRSKVAQAQCVPLDRVSGKVCTVTCLLPVVDTRTGVPSYAEGPTLDACPDGVGSPSRDCYVLGPDPDVCGTDLHLSVLPAAVDAAPIADVTHVRMACQ